MFINTCAFLRPTFPQKLALCVPMFTYKANFWEKIGLKNEQVNMNEWVNGWTYKCIYRAATCAHTCALPCLVICSLVSLYSLTRVVTCAITRISTCNLRIWYLCATRPSSWKTLFTDSSNQLNYTFLNFFVFFICKRLPKHSIRLVYLPTLGGKCR